MVIGGRHLESCILRDDPNLSPGTALAKCVMTEAGCWKNAALTSIVGAQQEWRTAGRGIRCPFSWRPCAENKGFRFGWH